jgi:hypothetical protein
MFLQYVECIMLEFTPFIVIDISQVVVSKGWAGAQVVESLPSK